MIAAPTSSSAKAPRSTAARCSAHACKVGLWKASYPKSKKAFSRAIDHRRLRARRHEMGRALRRPLQGNIVYAGRPRFRQGLGHGSPARLKRRIRKTQFLHEKMAHRGVGSSHRCSPEIEYREPATGKVRHPFFKCIREDL